MTATPGAPTASVSSPAEAASAHDVDGTLSAAPAAGADPAGPARRGTGAHTVARRVGHHALVLAAFTVPAVALWWHVWSGHPASALTCDCGDAAQQVWFTAWPAWSLVHAQSPFFSTAVNVPAGANLLSNTAGTLVGAVLAPVTWLWGPVVATNVALTLAPALSAWGCYAAARRLVRWKAAAVPAGLVYGYSSAMVASLAFAHVSVSVLVVPPLLFVTVYEAVAVRRRSPRWYGMVIAALLVVQFLISPEILVMCLLFTGIGLAASAAVCWRQVRGAAADAARALGVGIGAAALVLAYPIWFGLAGPQAVTGVLFALAPLSGVPLSGVLSPGQFDAVADAFFRFGGYLGRMGPPPDYLGFGLVALAVGSVMVAWRRALTWVLAALAVVALGLSLGQVLIGAPPWLEGVWLPWRALARLPVLREILPDQFAPFLSLFVALLVAVGIDATAAVVRRRPRRFTREGSGIVAVVTAAAALALVPVAVTFDIPYRVVDVSSPPYLSEVAPALPAGTVLLTVPFAFSGSSAPMLWQALDTMHFKLAGAALKTPGPLGGPVQNGVPGSARRILSDLTIGGSPLPTGTPSQITQVRHALESWQVGEVVIAGFSRDPVYSSGFFTMALGTAPRYEDRAWVWRLRSGSSGAPPAVGASLAACRAEAGAAGLRRAPLSMARCVLRGAAGA